MSSPARLVGVWDGAANDITLGSLLLFTAGLYGQFKARKSARCEVIFLGLEGPVPLVEAIMPSMSFIDNHDYQEQMAEADKGEQWPDDPATYTFDSTLGLQEDYERYGTVPEVPLNDDLLKWAAHWLAHMAGSRWPVVVHLKNNSDKAEKSNADIDAWLNFFIKQKDSDTMFVLTGNETIDEQVRALDNTVVTAEEGLILIQELALIHRAGAFMGMSSGPCNMGICSRTPYVIFKNPDHHVVEMEAELGDSDHYSFASAGQRFLRQAETVELLSNEFVKLRSYVRAAV